MEKHLLKQKNININIQVLRGGLCLLIVFFHYSYRYFQIFGQDQTSFFCSNIIIASLGDFSVLCFYIISGLYTHTIQGSSKLKKMLFWMKKILSIYFVYLMAIVLIYLISLFGNFGTNRNPNFIDFIQNIFFINQLTGAKSVDSAHWFVFYLFIINGWLALLNFLGKDRNFISIFGIISLNFILFLGCISFSGSMQRICYIFYRLLGAKYLGMVLIGYIWYLFKLNNENKYLLLWIISISLLMVEVIYEKIIYLLIVPVAVIIVYIFYMNIIKIKKQKNILIIIGNASLSIYLIHQNIGYFIINLFRKNLGYFGSVTITFFLIISLGLCFYIFVEKPIKYKINILFQ